MAKSGAASFTKTILLPLFISAGLYLILFHALIPLYRRHRARYSQYLPLQSPNGTTLFPESLRPSSLRDSISNILYRLFLPSTWAFRNRGSTGRGGATTGRVVNNADAELFDVESGEAMVGFDSDVQDRSRRRDGMERQLADMDAATRTVSRSSQPPAYSHTLPPTSADSDRRLSRDLEEGFRDDSSEEDEDEQQDRNGNRH
ncbi:hypothetical protein HRR83_002283 [Exophiala dermatitidis]|uniref:Uncharacterized protein n=2 Tax=Exophiala dermatitidis TaxID=5970 RepID=H6BY13_EXODN